MPLLFFILGGLMAALRSLDLENVDILAHLKVAYREVVAERNRPRKIVAMRRILVALSDILDIYIRFQRDKRWDDREW